MSMVLVSTLFLHAKLITSLHHKSQLLKAEYSVDWSSIEYELPGFSQFLDGKALSNLTFDVEINNPTEFDIVIENSQVIVEQKAIVVATIDLSGFEIPAGESRRVNMKLNSDSDMSQLTNFKDILENWRVDMHVNIWPGIPFVLNIVEQ